MADIQFDINKFKAARIVVFGDMMIDEYLSGNVSRISPEAPVPVVHIQSETFGWSRKRGSKSLCFRCKCYSYKLYR